MTHKQFAALARSVFGRTWQVEIAKRNQVHRSTAHRWGNGKIALDPEVIEWLKREAARRMAELKQAIAA